MGNPKDDGTCECDTGEDARPAARIGPNCQCVAGFAGTQCEHSRENTCSSGGNPRDDGTCECDTSGEDARIGQDCEYRAERAQDCGDGDGTIRCKSGFTGELCNDVVGLSEEAESESEDLGDIVLWSAVGAVFVLSLIHI